MHETLEIIAKNSPHLNWIKDKTLFLTLAGSRSYGLETPESDYDWRGICSIPKEYYLGFNKSFEQAILQAPHPDTTIFELRKFFNLATSGNPNCLEILFTEPEDHVLINDTGKILFDNREKFISRNLKERYIGYAKSQAHRIRQHKRFLDGEVLPPPTREEFGLKPRLEIKEDQLLTVRAEIAKKLDKWNCDFEPFSEPQKIYLKNKVSNILAEMNILSDNKWELAARDLGASENFILLLQKENAYQKLIDDYKKFCDWKKNRNPKRAALERKIGYDSKFALHLIRLLKTGKEVLLTGKLQVKRIYDREELMEIKNCLWSYQRLIEYADKIEDEVKEAYFKSPLPVQPNINELQQLCVNLIQKDLDREASIAA